MKMSSIPRLKVNWFPVLFPQGDTISVAGKWEDEWSKPDRADVKQYRKEDRWLAVCIPSIHIPQGFEKVSFKCQEVPQLTSTLIMEAVISHFESLSYRADRGWGQCSVVIEKKVPGLPSKIAFFEGLVIKPFHIRDPQGTSFGLVLDYITQQQFNCSVAQDSSQLHLATGLGFEVNADGLSGKIAKIDGEYAKVRTRGELKSVQLSKIRVKANYPAIREYVRLVAKGSYSNIVKQLMIESLSLSKSGFSNINRLADRYRKIEGLLQRNLSGNINVQLPTLCRSSVSVVSEPADLNLTEYET